MTISLLSRQKEVSIGLMAMMAMPLMLFTNYFVDLDEGSIIGPIASMCITKFGYQVFILNELEHLDIGCPQIVDNMSKFTSDLIFVNKYLYSRIKVEARLANSLHVHYIAFNALFCNSVHCAKNSSHEDEPAQQNHALKMTNNVRDLTFLLFLVKNC